MKFIKLYESFKDIDSICKKYGIKNYTINSDGTIDVDGDVYLHNNEFTKLPLKFGKVSGSFHCYANKLTTLEGCPESVGGYFNCFNNQLTTLEGGPQSVSRDFECRYNQLTTLEGGPQSVGGTFAFSGNKLKDLYGFPEFFEGGIIYQSNPVEEILDLFKNYRQSNNRIMGKVIDLLNEYSVIQQDGKVVILDRLEEIFYTLNMEIPKEINLDNYEVY